MLIKINCKFGKIEKNLLYAFKSILLYYFFFFFIKDFD